MIKNNIFKSQLMRQRFHADDNRQINKLTCSVFIANKFSRQFVIWINCDCHLNQLWQCNQVAFYWKFRSFNWFKNLNECLICLIHLINRHTYCIKNKHLWWWYQLISSDVRKTLISFDIRNKNFFWWYQLNCILILLID